MDLALSNRWYKKYFFIFCRIAPDDTVHYVDQCLYLKIYLKVYLKSDRENYSSNSLLSQNMPLLIMWYISFCSVMRNSVMSASILTIEK